MDDITTYIAFAGSRRVGEGRVEDILPILAQRFEKDCGDTTLVFDVQTGRSVDFDLRAPLDEILSRYGVTTEKAPRGRPRLGVVSREISLLPRHWDWLDQQPNGISAALRRLVERAMKNQPGKDRARQIRAATSQILTAIAGNRPHYEEVCRALFNGDAAVFNRLTARWPKDIAHFAQRQMDAALRAERE